jgi:glycosyltransferase involved in cell wall biosynthesis
MPYLLAETSFAPKQEGGAWALGHAATARAIRAADVVLALTAIDAECLAPLVAPPSELRRLPPFVDPAPARTARNERERHRAALARRFGLDPEQPWLLTVAMMRADVKRASYGLLAQALAQLLDLRWQLLVVGDGPARPEVVAMLRALGDDRVRLAGLVPEEALPPVYAAADLYVWPALREAYGLAMLEAQAAGLPVVAGGGGGVAEVVAAGRSGVLTAPGDPGACAGAVRDLLARPERRQAMAEAAARLVAEERSIGRAAAELASALVAAATIRAMRR